MTPPPAEGRSRAAPRSLQAEYQHFIEQRIEEYKDQLPRRDILAIGDEAVGELAKGAQLQLTEVVLRDQVDAIIRRRLRLPSFRRWRDKHLTLRAAQADPGHWGLAAHDPVVALAETIQDGDWILAVGALDGACALFLAARGASVRVVDPDLAAVYKLEDRAIHESLGGHIECEVVPLASCALTQPFAACVIEASAITAMSATERGELVERLKQATPPGGRHAVMPATQVPEHTHPISSDALRTLYADWDVTLPPGRRRNAGFLALKNGVVPESE